MHRRDAKEKRAMARRYSSIADTVRNGLTKRKSDEKAREIFNTPPYYLTVNRKENKENE